MVVRQKERILKALRDPATRGLSSQQLAELLDVNIKYISTIRKKSADVRQVDVRGNDESYIVTRAVQTLEGACMGISTMDVTHFASRTDPSGWITSLNRCIRILKQTKTKIKEGRNAQAVTEEQ